MTGILFLSLRTGMCDGLAFWVLGMSLLCLLLVLCGFNTHFVGNGMQDGLEMCLVWFEMVRKCLHPLVVVYNWWLVLFLIFVKCC